MNGWTTLWAPPPPVELAPVSPVLAEARLVDCAVAEGWEMPVPDPWMPMPTPRKSEYRSEWPWTVRPAAATTCRVPLASEIHTFWPLLTECWWVGSDTPWPWPGSEMEWA